MYHYRGSGDRLVMYPSGKLRHYVLKHQHGNDDQEQEYVVEHERSFDYEHGYYCMDKVYNNYFIIVKINHLFIVYNYCIKYP